MKIDWQRLLLNLRQAKLSLSAVSKICHIDPATVGHLSRCETREPKFSQGLALLDLHLQICPDKHKELAE